MIILFGIWNTWTQKNIEYFRKFFFLFLIQLRKNSKFIYSFCVWNDILLVNARLRVTSLKVNNYFQPHYESEICRKEFYMRARCIYLWSVSNSRNCCVSSTISSSGVSRIDLDPTSLRAAVRRIALWDCNF